jgi:MoxR-vWA-beta-propeller ternary system domain bpX5
VRITFTPRDDILEPIAVAGLGAAARTLAHRLLALDDDRLRQLRGTAGNGILIALGETAALPWAAGVTYLGQDPDAPKLLVPPMLRPAIALDIFERAIARHAAPLPAPWAIFHSPPCVVSVAAATVIDREELQIWLDEQP